MPISVSNLTIPATAVIAILGATLGAFQWADGRYARADEVKEQIGTLRAEVRQNAERTQEQIRQSRIQQLEDKIFELQLKTSKTSSDLALIQRYQEQLQQLKR